MNEAEIRAGLPPTPGYRYAKVTGNQLHVAGQVPQDSEGNIVGVGDPYAQATQCLANLRLLMTCHGFREQDVQHLTMYVVGPRENLTSTWKAVSAAFSNEVPPATLLGVSLLGYAEQLVEIDARIIKEEPLDL